MAEKPNGPVEKAGRAVVSSSYHQCMVMETRDYYIKRLREKLGYKERASFRRPVFEFYSTIRQSLEVRPVKKFRLNIVWRVMLWFLAIGILVKIAQNLL